MTPEEVITNAILEADARNGFPSPRNFRAQYVLSALSNAGFVVVPREPTESDEHVVDPNKVSLDD